LRERETVSYPHTGNSHASGPKIMTLFCKEQKQGRLESKILYIYIQLLVELSAIMRSKMTFFFLIDRVAWYR